MSYDKARLRRNGKERRVGMQPGRVPAQHAKCPTCNSDVRFEWEVRDGIRTGRLVERCPTCQPERAA